MTLPSVACQPHDHTHCIHSAMTAAEYICDRDGARLTPLRRRVLELVWSSHRPLGAYEILAILSQEEGRNAAPPTVYRALDFLLERGLVHRLTSLNAFAGCAYPGERHPGHFLICRQCRNAIEMHDSRIGTAVQDAAQTADFLIEEHTVEVQGICSGCRGAA